MFKLPYTDGLIDGDDGYPHEYRGSYAYHRGQNRRISFEFTEKQLRSNEINLFRTGTDSWSILESE
jgi:hypothetical protein